MSVKNPFLRACLYCGKSFEAKHGNRQFCPPDLKKPGQRDCKITYNNLKAKERREETKEFNHVALKNMLILDEFYKEDVTLVISDELDKAGFDAAKSTGIMVDPDDQTIIPIFYKYKLINVAVDLFKIEKL